MHEDPTLPRILMRPRRRYRCLALPDAFVPPEEPADQARLTAAIRDALTPDLHPVIRPAAPGAWLCAFLHAAPRPKRAATYEHGRPGTVRFTPRAAALLLADWRHGLLYAATPRRDALPGFLAALNGTLFPGRRPAAPFQTLPLDPDRLRLLSPQDRRPGPPGAPWAELRLKALAWQEPGLGGARGELRWDGDGFDAAEPWPERLQRLTFLIRPPGAKPGAAFVAELHRGGELLAALSPHTLPALAALIGHAS